MELTLNQIKQHLKRQNIKYISVYPGHTNEEGNNFLFARFEGKSPEECQNEFNIFWNDTDAGYYTIIAKIDKSSHRGTSITGLRPKEDDIYCN